MNKVWSVCALGAMALSGAAWSQVSEDVIRIGFISDMSGIYRDYDGPAGADAIRMAIADVGGAVNGKKIELLIMDHQNKPDIAAAKAREWFDVNKVDMLIGGVNSGAAIAMAGVAAEKKKPYFVVGSGASSLTNEFCSPYTVHYAYDTVALARGTAGAVVKGGGNPGTSCRPTTPSVPRCRTMRPRSSWPTAAPSPVRSSIHWVPATSRPSCCRPRARRRRCSRWPMRAATP
ncbi:hypothetical protein J2W36_003055 [Variovorax ginsengisoli]|uniref:Leucine-binding protein domain-containing protein n=1 Tax=Variovorax ginsengisoli TaxID=363844 RepID=A0ABT9S8W2_9BURK|nr:hypothetical protein [Variovorax ginsengisoli]